MYLLSKKTTTPSELCISFLRKQLLRPKYNHIHYYTAIPQNKQPTPSQLHTCTISSVKLYTLLHPLSQYKQTAPSQLHIIMNYGLSSSVKTIDYNPLTSPRPRNTTTNTQRLKTKTNNSFSSAQTLYTHA